jgi:hypothetical protein
MAFSVRWVLFWRDHGDGREQHVLLLGAGQTSEAG